MEAVRKVLARVFEAILFIGIYKERRFKKMVFVNLQKAWGNFWYFYSK